MIDADDHVELTLGIPKEQIPANSMAAKNKAIPRNGRANVHKRTEPIAPKEKSIWQRIKEAFIGDDIKSLPERVLFNRVIPSVKRSVHDVLDDTIDGILGPKSKASEVVKRATRSDDDGYIVDYGAYYRGPREYPRSRESRIEFIRQYVFPSKDEAEAELRLMRDQIENHEFCSVLFVRNRFGEPVLPIDEKWGWYSLRTADAIPVENGMYIIDLPEPRFRERNY